MNITAFPTVLFTFSEYWWFYAAFILFVFALLFIDLFMLNGKDNVVSVRQSLRMSFLFVIIALLFNVAFYLFASQKSVQWFLAHPWAVPQGMTAQTAGMIEGKNAGLEFLSGYIVEKALAFDNIFVFVLIFKYFSVQLKYQHKVLFFGILGALIFRAVFISVGSILMEYDWILILFGGFLVLTGLKMFFIPDNEAEFKENFLIRLFYRSGKISKKSIEETKGKFCIKENGKWYFTTLFLVLVIIEFSDIIFALDSVPAIFAITREPLIVFTSNIFAILGLRSLYFLLANMVDKFAYLKYGVAIILIYIGLKMSWLHNAFDGRFASISFSLGFIITTLSIFIVFSFWRNSFKKS